MLRGDFTTVTLRRLIPSAIYGSSVGMRVKVIQASRCRTVSSCRVQASEKVTACCVVLVKQIGLNCKSPCPSLALTYLFRPR